MTDSNVLQLSQPGTLCDPLTEVLRSGARALLAQAVAAEVAGQGAQYVRWHAPDAFRRRLRMTSPTLPLPSVRISRKA